MLDLHPRRRPLAVTLALVALLLGACQGAGSGASAAGSEPAASEEAPPSEAAASTAASEPADEPSEGAAAGGVVLVAESALGPVLTDANGMTLYLFTNDSPGESACTDDCAVNWPPLTVAAEADAVAGDGVTGELGTIARDDGTLQVTIAGVPLYLYAADGEPGDISGHQVGGVWFAVAPDGAPAGDEAGQDDYDY
jgi:predicted lipoprotein with Yx(FWY)xxD motif